MGSGTCPVKGFIIPGVNHPDLFILNFSDDKYSYVPFCATDFIEHTLGLVFNEINKKP
jgi:hypothetical protein